MPIQTTYTEARANLAKRCDQVAADWTWRSSHDATRRMSR